MSFLLEEEQTLEAALAFIESCLTSDNGASDHSTDSDRALRLDFLSPTSPSLSSSQQSNTSVTNCADGLDPKQAAFSYQQAQLLRGTKSKSKANPRPAASSARKHRKIEILALREQVLQLTARFTHLSRFSTLRPTRRAAALRGGHRTNESSTNTFLEQFHLEKSMALDDSLMELQKLHESEKLNRRLKDALKTQVGVMQTLECLFRRQTTKQVRPT